MSKDEFQSNGFSIKEMNQWRKIGSVFKTNSFLARKWKNAGFNPSYTSFLYPKFHTPQRALKFLEQFYSLNKLNYDLSLINEVILFELKAIETDLKSFHKDLSVKQNEIYSEKINRIYNIFKRENLKTINPELYSNLIKNLNSLIKKNNLKIKIKDGVNMGRDSYFKGLLNIVAMKSPELKKEIEAILKKYEKEDEILFSDMMQILKKVALYFKTTTDKYPNEEYDKVGEKLVKFYKNKTKEISGKDLESLREIIGIVLFSFGWNPIDAKGNDLGKDDIVKFRDEVYKKFE